MKIANKENMLSKKVAYEGQQNKKEHVVRLKKRLQWFLLKRTHKAIVLRLKFLKRSADTIGRSMSVSEDRTVGTSPNLCEINTYVHMRHHNSFWGPNPLGDPFQFVCWSGGCPLRYRTPQYP
jgi:hypothetical protein